MTSLGDMADILSGETPTADGGNNGAPPSGVAGQRKPPPNRKTSGKRKQPAKKTKQADTEAPTRPADATSGMAATSSRGDLVQARVQPAELAEWFNTVVDAGAFVFQESKGKLAAAVLLIARNHVDELIELLELWAGAPADPMRRMLWDQLKSTELARLADQRHRSGDTDDDTEESDTGDTGDAEDGDSDG